MDTNIDLRRDKFLFPNGYGIGNRRNSAVVATLREKGIETVEQLINCNASDFSNQNRHFYMALIQILRHKYLGEELINDVLLEKEYKITRNIAKEIAKDLRKLGLGSNSIHTRRLQNLTNYISLYIVINNLTGKTISMEELIKETEGSGMPSLLGVPYRGDSDFRGYYLSYIEEKRKKELQEQDSPTKDVLEGLKLQLQGLIMARDGIDKQIIDVQEQIKALDRGQKTYGRK